MLHDEINGRFQEAAMQRSPVWRMTAVVKDFRCGPWCNGAGLRVVGPRWKSSQGGSRGGQALSMGKVG
jgi:hypothetical protein